MMSETGPELGLRDEDRLPWLEAVESEDDGEGVSSGKLIAFMLAGLAAIGLVVGGVWWLRNQEAEPQGDGTLIAAPQGDYKVKPEAPGGMKVEGQGDSAFAASEGAEANGKVDTMAQPEAPVAVQKPAPIAAKPAIAAKRAVTTPMPPSGGKLVPPAPSGTLIQLGAYNSEAIANNAWRVLVAKTPALANLPKSVVTATVGGKTYYRLRANAGSPANAAALCGQVGNCMVVR
jgi:hypothetical protein